MENRNVFSQGYGIIPKLVMLEGSVSIDAKALYAYFCAYSGSGYSCYPPRGQILNDLGISHATYYVYLKELQDGGYITIKKHRTQSQTWCNNRFILMQNHAIMAKAEEKGYRRIGITDGLRDYGYGRIPLAVMTDRRISRKAKAMYAYFCGFAGNTATCDPEIEDTLRFLNISINSYYKYLNELLVFNYITSFHRKDERGRYTSNSIVLNREPNHAAGLLQLEERRARFEERLNGNAVQPPKRRKKHKPTIQTPQQLTAVIRQQIGYDALAKSQPESKLQMITGFIAELSFDPYSPVEAATVDSACVQGFIVHMEHSINPSAAIKNPVSYWKRAFINYLVNREMQTGGMLKTC